jgi:membrane protease YdiL (CAAX protease family)
LSYLKTEDFFVAGVLVLSLLVCLGLAHWAWRAERDRSALIGLYILVGFPGLLMLLFGLARVSGGRESGLVWLAAGLGLILPLLRTFRIQFAKVTAIDPSSAIDALGLSAVLGLIGFLGFTFAINPDPADTGEVQISDLLSQFAFMIALAFILVGVGQWRTLGQSVRRLGLLRPTTRQVGFAILAVLVAFFVMGLAGILTAAFQPDFNEEIDQSTEDITANVNNVVGAVFFGLGAGLSEETLLRGALQPRYGIWVTSFLFALLHSQYGISFILGGVFGMGLVLGYLRKRFNTTTAIITHAIFNTIVVLVGIYSD